MLIAALFTIARTWKQPQCPSTDEWIKKMWHIYTMEYYSAIKRNEIELFVVGATLRCSVLIAVASQRRLLSLWSTGSRCVGFSSCGTRAQ